MPKKYTFTQHDYEMLRKLFPDLVGDSLKWEDLSVAQKEYLVSEFKNAPPEIKLMAAIYGMHFGFDEVDGDEEETVH